MSIMFGKCEYTKLSKQSRSEYIFIMISILFSLFLITHLWQENSSGMFFVPLYTFHLLFTLTGDHRACSNWRNLRRSHVHHFLPEIIMRLSSSSIIFSFHLGKARTERWQKISKMAESCCPISLCDRMNVIGPHKLIGSGTIRRCGFVGVGVV